MIEVGATLPEATLVKVGADGPEPVQSPDYFKGRKVALFCVPGAFTPTCSVKHLPGFVDNAQALYDKGVDEIACVAVNDPFVLGAWAKSADADGITMLSDGNADFVRAAGLDLDASKFGMGTRGKRFSMLVDDGRVTHLNIEEGGEFRVSSAEHLLGQF